MPGKDKTNEEQIRIVRPDGSVVLGTREELTHLEKLGYHEENVGEGRWRAGEVQTEKDYTTGEEKLKTVGEGLVSGATLGLSDPLITTDRTRLRAKYNPGLREGAELVGGIAPALIPGGEFTPAGALSKLATKAGEAVGTGLAAKAVTGAIEGGGVGFQQEMADAELTNTPFNAEAVLHGVGAGAILSAGLHALGTGAERVGKRFEPEIVKAPLVNAENYGQFRAGVADIKSHVPIVDNELARAQAELDLLKADDAAALEQKQYTVKDLKKQVSQAEKDADNADALHADEVKASKKIVDSTQADLDAYNSTYGKDLASATAQRDADTQYGGLLHSREKLDEVMDNLHKKATSGDKLLGDSELLSDASKARKQFEKAIKNKDFLTAEEMLKLYRSKLEEFSKSADIGTKTIFKDVPKVVNAPGGISKKLVPTTETTAEYTALESAKARAEAATKQAEKELRRKAKTILPETQKELTAAKKAFDDAKAAFEKAGSKQFKEVEHVWDPHAQEYLNKQRVNEAGVVRPKGHIAEYTKVPEKALENELPQVNRIFRDATGDLAADTAEEYPALLYGAKQAKINHDRLVASGPQRYKDLVVQLDSKLQQAESELANHKPVDLTAHQARIDEVTTVKDSMAKLHDFPDTPEQFVGLKPSKLDKMMEAVDNVLSAKIPELKPLQDSLQASVDKLTDNVGIKLPGNASDKLRAIRSLAGHPEEVAKAKKYASVSGFTQYGIGRGVASATGTGMPGYYGTRLLLSNLLGAKAAIENKLSGLAKSIGKGLKSKATTKYIAPRLQPLYNRLTGGKDDKKLSPNQAALNRINELTSITPQLPDLAFKGLQATGLATTHNDLATGIHQALVNGFNEVMNMLPRDSTGVVSGMHSTYVPDDTETLITAKIVGAIQNPMSVFEDISKGVIDPIQVQAVKAFAPEMYNYFRINAMNNIDFSKMAYDDQIAYSVALDITINSGADPMNIVDAQAQFAETPQMNQNKMANSGGQKNNAGGNSNSGGGALEPATLAQKRYMT